MFGIHLTILGKTRLDKIFVNKVNNYPGSSFVFFGRILFGRLLVYHNTIANEETFPYDCKSFSDFGKHLSNSCEYDSCNRITEAKI